MMKAIGKTQYNYLKQYMKHDLKDIEYVHGVPKVVFLCWFGPNKNFTPEFTNRRYHALISLIHGLKVPVIILTWENYKSFEVKTSSMHPCFEFLSGNHKSDYLRAYLLYHYGGAYHDIKYRELTWEHEWNKFSNPNTWIIGRREMKPDVIAYLPGEEWVQRYYDKLVTMGWFISRPMNKYIKTILDKQNHILTEKEEILLKNPAIEGRQAEQTSTENPNYLYPLRYLELMGEICHHLQLQFLENIDYTLPDILYKTYK